MSSSLNMVILEGRVGQPPEIRYTQAGTAVCDLSVATSDKWKDKNSGDMKEETEWSKCVLWGQHAEFAGNYVRKGMLVGITGSLKTEKWQDKEGGTRYTTKIRVRDFRLLTPRSEGEQRNAPPRDEVPSSSPAPESAAPLEDDIPF